MLRQLREPGVTVTVVTFVIAAGFALFMTRPIRAGTLGYDAAGSVLYFDRIIAGRHLEAFLGATPKPLLTVVYGIIHGLVPDWRAISMVAIAAYAGGIAAAAALAYRLEGAIAAGFVAAGLLASAELLQDVDLAYAVSWALLFWAIAGILVTNARPRYAWAGLALALGGTARLETMIVVAFAAVGLLGLLVYQRQHAIHGSPVRSRLPVLIGFVALPIQMLHDLLLTGDPAYSQVVPVLGSAGLSLPGPVGVARQIAAHFASEPAVLLLGLVGVWILIRGGHWAITSGVMALGLGVFLFLEYLAVRGVYVSGRYVAPIDLALTFSAGIGAASIFGSALANALGRASLGSRAPIAQGLVGAVVAVALIRPFGPLDPATRAAIVANGSIHRDLLTVTPVIGAALASQGVTPWPANGSPTRPMGDEASLLVPVLTVPQVAVDLDLPLSALTGTRAQSIATDGSYPHPGQILFHHLDRDAPAAAFKIFEVSARTLVGGIVIRPILSDPRGRYWLVRIEP